MGGGLKESPPYFFFFPFSLSIESDSFSNGDGVTRTDYAKLHFSQPLQTLFGELRRICDPHALFAPAKKGYSTSTAKYQLRTH
jgi:hypothetical protein